MTEQKRVLIIDDDLFFSDIYSMELQKAGFSVTTAGSGELGLSKIGLERPNLVLLDIAMPELDGLTVLERIRQKSEYDVMKVLLLTNMRDEETIKLGLSKGANGYLIKTSLTPEQIVTEVKKELETYSPHPETIYPGQ